jgi:hypothetical protein
MHSYRPKKQAQKSHVTFPLTLSTAVIIIPENLRILTNTVLRLRWVGILFANGIWKEVKKEL